MSEKEGKKREKKKVKSKENKLDFGLNLEGAKKLMRQNIRT